MPPMTMRYLLQLWLMRLRAKMPWQRRIHVPPFGFRPASTVKEMTGAYAINKFIDQLDEFSNRDATLLTRMGGCFEFEPVDVARGDGLVLRWISPQRGNWVEVEVSIRMAPSVQLAFLASQTTREDRHDS